MPNSGTAEIYFIAAMMILILIISAVSVFVFFRTYKKEKTARENRRIKQELEKKRKESAEK